ncbi:hypothetical protein BCV70DRAFT_202522, partial [Testicularia cyperi]
MYLCMCEPRTRETLRCFHRNRSGTRNVRTGCATCYLCRARHDSRPGARTRRTRWVQCRC